jgi:sortase A
MRIVIKAMPSRPVLRWIQGLLFAAAALMLGYCAFVLADAWIFQNQESAALARFAPAESAASGVELPEAIGPNGLIGRIGIPRLDISAVVVEGTSSKTLRRAVGHIAGTALPGEPGNVGIAGHRDTFFRPLRNIQPNDIITLTTLRGEYRYRVVSAHVVKPDNVSVLNGDGNEILTLVTCYPFYYVGPAPQRFIVRAARVI